jgi:hypothetical protein
MREYVHKPRYREVPETGYSVLSGLIYHLSVISSAHSVDNRMGAPGDPDGKSDGPDRRTGARMGALGGAIILATGGWYWLDPAVALTIAVVIAYHALALLKKVFARLRPAAH